MLVSQAPPQKPLTGAIASHSDWPKPRASDVDSVDHILAALYDVISGPAHQPRDWNRMRSLFVPDARLIPVRPIPANGTANTTSSTDVFLLSIDDYIARSSARMEAEGFFERGTHNEIAAFGNIVSVFSTYESRHTLEDAKPFARGINSIQLVKDGNRFWVVDVFWDSERPDSPIPPRYLPGADPAAGTNTSEVDPPHLTAAFAGEWTGKLEYRDYQSNARVALPTKLSATASTDGREATLNYTYHDGPGKTVHETEMFTLFPRTGTATLVSGNDHESATFSVSGLDAFGQSGVGTLILTGKGTENDKPVDARITITLAAGTLTWLKETRAAGTSAEFAFRDGYTFTRVTP